MDTALRLIFPAFALIGLLGFGALHAGTGIVVTTMADEVVADGQCSLREAIVNANNDDQSGSADCFAGSPIADEILFDASLAGQVLTLDSALPVITGNLAITGPATGQPAGLVIDAAEQFRVFHAQGGAPSEFTLALTDLTLVNGQTGAAQAPGGAVLAEQADLWFDRVVVGHSRTLGFQSFGGAVAVVDGNLELLDTRIENSQTFGNSAGGGGLSVTGNLLMQRSSVTGNSTAGDQARGGGLVVGGQTLIRESTIAGNATAGSAAHGGGLALVGGDLELINSTVSGNRADGPSAEGGGLHSTSGAIELLHVTLAFNEAAAGGVDGLWRGGAAPASPLVLHNSLIVRDRDGSSGCSTPADVHANSVATDASCTGSATPLAAIGLEPLADHGGPTWTHAFTPPSAALNSAGDCQADHGLSKDQRGQPRPGRGSTSCDMGAWEYQAPYCVTSSQELQAALDQAASNGIDDVIRVAAGHYVVPAGGFNYLAQATSGDARSLRLSGGWTTVGQNDCAERPVEDPFLTVLDGQGSEFILQALMKSGAELAIELLHFKDGHSSLEPGGALRAGYPGSSVAIGRLRLERNAFTGNQAPSAGALHLDLGDLADGSSIEILNNLFEDNLGAQSPGTGYLALYRNSDPGADVSLLFISNTVIENHFADPGPFDTGGFVIQPHHDIPTRFINNLMWGSSGNDLWLMLGSALDYRHNNVGLVNAGMGQPAGTGNLSVVPEFADCSGCPWRVPASGSDLVDAGIEALPGEPWSLSVLDAAGQARVQGAGVEIGAFENTDVLFRDRFE